MSFIPSVSLFSMKALDPELKLLQFSYYSLDAYNIFIFPSLIIRSTFPLYQASDIGVST